MNGRRERNSWRKASTLALACLALALAAPGAHAAFSVEPGSIDGGTFNGAF
jgi:hypothetical protein